MPSGKKRKRHKMSTHKRKKRLRKNRHKKKKQCFKTCYIFYIEAGYKSFTALLVTKKEVLRCRMN